MGILERMRGLAIDELLNDMVCNRRIRSKGDELSVVEGAVEQRQTQVVSKIRGPYEGIINVVIMKVKQLPEYGQGGVGMCGNRGLNGPVVLIRQALERLWSGVGIVGNRQHEQNISAVVSPLIQESDRCARILCHFHLESGGVDLKKEGEVLVRNRLIIEMERHQVVRG